VYDTTAVNRTINGLLKLLYPDREQFISDEDLEWAVRLAMECRRRVKEQQKPIGSAEFRNTHFSYQIGNDGVEVFVVTPELQSDNSIGTDPLPPGQVWAISPGGPDENAGLYRIDVNTGPGAGVKIINVPMPGPFRESIKYGEQNLLMRAKELVGSLRPCALFNLALATGMRRGELMGLKWQDIDFATNTLQIRRTLSRFPSKLAAEKGRGFEETEPKTKQSRRSVVTAPFAIEALKLHRIRQLEAKLKAGPAWKEHDYVFCTSVGTHLHPDRDILSQLKILLKKASLPSRLACASMDAKAACISGMRHSGTVSTPMASIESTRFMPAKRRSRYAGGMPGSTSLQSRCISPVCMRRLSASRLRSFRRRGRRMVCLCISSSVIFFLHGKTSAPE
jgi:Putative ATP-dependent Lon protease/Phage integrase family